MGSRHPAEAGHAGVGDVLDVIRRTGGATRSDLLLATGLSRPALADRLDVLLRAELVREAGAVASDGGRPRVTVELNASGGALLVADLGRTRVRAALLDLAGAVVAERRLDAAGAAGASAPLDAVETAFDELLRAHARRRADVRGVALGVPAPGAFATGLQAPAGLVPGWDEPAVRDWFRERWPVPVVVDSAVNLMAYGEQQASGGVEHLLCIEVGEGIACGIVSGGRILRGADGAAGTVGHIAVGGYDHVTCACGNRGCLEAVAGGAALAARLREAGRDAAGSVDVVRHVRAADPLANRLVREAGRCLGEVLSRCVSMFNPGAIVIGGPLAEAEEPLLAGVRELTIGRSPALATRHLRIVPGRLGDRAALAGAGSLLCEHVFAPAVVDDALGSPARRRNVEFR